MPQQMMTGVSDKGTPICCMAIEPKMGLKILVIFEILSIISLIFFLKTICFNNNYVVCQKDNLMENDGFLRYLGSFVATPRNNLKKLYEED